VQQKGRSRTKSCTVLAPDKIGNKPDELFRIFFSSSYLILKLLKLKHFFLPILPYISFANNVIHTAHPFRDLVIKMYVMCKLSIYYLIGCEIVKI